MTTKLTSRSSASRRCAPDGARPAARWPALLIYGVGAGAIMTGAIYVVGGLTEYVIGRRTVFGVVLQVAVSLGIAASAGYFADGLISRCRRDWQTLKRYARS